MRRPLVLRQAQDERAKAVYLSISHLELSTPILIGASAKFDAPAFRLGSCKLPHENGQKLRQTRHLQVRRRHIRRQRVAVAV